MSDARAAARDETTRGDIQPELRPPAPALAVAPAPEPDRRLKLAPFRPFDEATAALPPRLARSLPIRIASRAVQLACIVYAAALLYWIWLAKDSGIAGLLNDPLFYGYSVLVSIYVVARFALAPFYRALTNYVLRNWRITYQSRARSHTLVPESLRVFGVQQLRWKKSWLRESLHVSSFIWRKNPIAAVLTYLGCLFPWVAPIVVLHSVWFRAIGNGSPLFYLMGAYVVAVLYSLYYAVSRRSPLWWHGISFVAIYMVFLVWQTYYALATIRNTSWGTRASTHSEEEGEIEVIGPAREEPAA